MTTPDEISINPPPPAKAVAAPVVQAERIWSLDVLRGVALLGILVMNIQAFAMVFAAYVNPHAYGDLTGANYLVWLLSHIFADRKFMTIFSMLFGAGIVLMTTRSEKWTGRSAGLHYRRMTALLVLGLIHAYLIWDGDILVTYALCGMAVFPFRRWRPTTLLLTGLILITVGSGITFFFQWTMPHWPAEEVQGLKDDFWQPSPEYIENAHRLRHGSWLGFLPERAKSAFFLQTFVLLCENLWRVSGLMLAGMALFKLGVFSTAPSRKTYAAMIIVGLLTGVSTIVAGILYRDAVSWDVRRCFFLGGQFNYWGSIPLAFAWVGAVMLACHTPTLTGLVRRSLAAVGRMAFTNYLMQSVLCTLLFNGYGLGWFGQVERIGQFGIVLGVWVLQLILSPLWLRRFRIGPAEWLWRSLTYGERQRFRR
ncbi:MAG: DUF418 domain-containing protein [Phycisphaerales bacterium]|nr:DUF418 domain-containing protein [Phycisphaerales bacterium]